MPEQAPNPDDKLTTSRKKKAGALPENSQTRDLDDILLRLENGISQERIAMGVLLSRLRMTSIAT